jgi:hypothetical protein
MSIFIEIMLTPLRKLEYRPNICSSPEINCLFHGDNTVNLPLIVLKIRTNEKLTCKNFGIISNTGRRVRLKPIQPTVSRLSRKCGSLDLVQRYEPSRPVTGIALSYLSSTTSSMRSYCLLRFCMTKIYL